MDTNPTEWWYRIYVKDPLALRYKLLKALQIEEDPPTVIGVDYLDFKSETVDIRSFGLRKKNYPIAEYYELPWAEEAFN